MVANSIGHRVTGALVEVKSFRGLNHLPAGIILFVAGKSRPGSIGQLRLSARATFRGLRSRRPSLVSVGIRSAASEKTRDHERNQSLHNHNLLPQRGMDRVPRNAPLAGGESRGSPHETGVAPEPDFYHNAAQH